MKNIVNIIKSPLRYPGGKSKALKQILPIIPSFDEYREPLVGGGSIFFALKQLNHNKKFWINDINEDLYLFWKYCRDDIKNLVKEVKRLKQTYKKGSELYSYFTGDQKFTNFERAVRLFVLNRITFSGLAESGGYSEQAFKLRFTDSSIERLEVASEILQSTVITNKDYREILEKSGKNVFIFLDPPYLSKSKSKLYGRNGNLHTSFEHKKFADNMEKCNHKWLITYDDSPEVRKLFPSAYKYEWELQYGMNNYKQIKSKKGKELFISNYKIISLEKSQSKILEF